jgi:hypothetical protein
MESSFSADERWKVEERIERLNNLGFEVGEITISADLNGARLSVQPKVVDAGHYSRKIMRLTGMDVQENQARRLINDIQQYRVMTDRAAVPQTVIAHDWMTHVFQPTINAVPAELMGKLEPAELFHQILDHRWFISEQAGRDIPTEEAVASFVENILRHQRDERSFLGPTSGDTDYVVTPTGPSAITPTGASARTPSEGTAFTPPGGTPSSGNTAPSGMTADSGGTAATGNTASTGGTAPSAESGS